MEGLRMLEWKEDIKENMQEASRITLEQLKEQAELSEVKNRYEGYGISAEGYVSIQKAMKSVKTDMDDFLKLLPVAEQNALNCISSLYNSALDVGVEALKLAAKALEQTEWIPITYRDADEDEQEDGAIYMLTCPLPEEGEEVLVSSGKYIRIDTMCYDKGWYFDSYGDIRDVDAWIPLPKPYRSE